jgi:hypothetical protein
MPSAGPRPSTGAPWHECALAQHRLSAVGPPPTGGKSIARVRPLLRVREEEEVGVRNHNRNSSRVLNANIVTQMNSVRRTAG